MFEQDYIMRLIHEMIRMLLKVVFHIDTDSPLIQQVKENESKIILEDLLDELDEGYINEAENKVYALLDGTNQQSLEIALLFYEYLNDKDDDFLTQHNFSREEIQLGLKHATRQYGLSGLSDLFLSDH